MIYSDKVMDHFNHPRNVGEIEGADAIGQVGNPVCGDILKMYLKIDGDVITDVKIKTIGCGSAIATSSMATELIKGKTIQEALTLTNAAVAEALDGLPAHKMHCSVLAEEAIKAALADYYTRQGLPCRQSVQCQRLANPVLTADEQSAHCLAASNKTIKKQAAGMCKPFRQLLDRKSSGAICQPWFFYIKPISKSGHTLASSS